MASPNKTIPEDESAEYLELGYQHLPSLPLPGLRRRSLPCYSELCKRRTILPGMCAGGKRKYGLHRLLEKLGVPYYLK